MPIHRLGWDEPPPPTVTAGAVSVGNFDGVHRGHAALIAELRRLARDAGGPATAVTFDPHPLAILNPGAAVTPLSTIDDRAQWLIDTGADHVVILRTEPPLLAMTADQFLEDVIRQRFAARAVVEGFNFGFGRQRAGSIETLKTWGESRGVALSIVPPLMTADGPVSSSRVRAAVVAGDVTLATDLLGRAYRLRGTVGTGERRGRTIGFPTANLIDPATLVPAAGVYAATATVPGGTWPAAVNIGTNPTFGGTARKIEAHLIGFAGDLYGRPIALEFRERLRDTRPFASVSDLVEQLKLDVERVTALDSETRP